MLKYEIHADFAQFMADLSRLYLDNAALSEWDYDKKGFEWVDCHQADKLLYLFERNSEHQKLLAAFNFSEKKQTYVFSDSRQTDFRQWSVLLNSNDAKYGGNGSPTKPPVQRESDTVILEIAPYSGILFELSEEQKITSKVLQK